MQLLPGCEFADSCDDFYLSLKKGGPGILSYIKEGNKEKDKKIVDWCCPSSKLEEKLCLRWQLRQLEFCERREKGGILQVLNTLHYRY